MCPLYFILVRVTIPEEAEKAIAVAIVVPIVVVAIVIIAVVVYYRLVIENLIEGYQNTNKSILKRKRWKDRDSHAASKAVAKKKSLRAILIHILCGIN